MKTIFLIGLLLLAGCAGGGHPSGVRMTVPQIGMNLGIGDLRIMISKLPTEVP